MIDTILFLSYCYVHNIKTNAQFSFIDKRGLFFSFYLNIHEEILQNYNLTKHLPL